MKVGVKEIKAVPEFVPVVITLTVETPEQATALHALLCVDQTYKMKGFKARATLSEDGTSHVGGIYDAINALESRVVSRGN